MEQLTTLEDSVKTENRKIVIVPRYGLQQGAVFLEPVYDQSTGTFKGIPYNWEELRKMGKAVATPDDSFKLDFPSQSKYELDLSNIQVAQRWNWMRHHGKVAESVEEILSNPKKFNCLAYVEDLESAMVKTASVKKVKFELEGWVRSKPAPEQVKICKLLGQNTSYMKPLDIEDYLVEKARSEKYQELVTIKDDTQNNSKLFLLELRDRKIIIPFHKGYKFGETVMGLDVASCIHWMNQQSNLEIVLQWKRQINMGFEGESFSIEDELSKPEKNKGGRPPLNKEVNA